MGLLLLCRCVTSCLLFVSFCCVIVFHLVFFLSPFVVSLCSILSSFCLLLLCHLLHLIFFSSPFVVTVKGLVCVWFFVCLFFLVSFCCVIVQRLVLNSFVLFVSLVQQPAFLRVLLRRCASSVVSLSLPASFCDASIALMRPSCLAGRYCKVGCLCLSCRSLRSDVTPSFLCLARL